MTLNGIKSLVKSPRCGLLPGVMLVALLGAPALAGGLPNSVAAEKLLDVSALRPETHEAMKVFRKIYRDRNVREFKHLPKEAAEDIVLTLERCLELGYQTNLREANRLLVELNRQYPKEPVLMWHLGMNYFLIARRLNPKTERDEQIRVLARGIERTGECLRIAPDNADCQLVDASSRGVLSLVEGLFATLSELSGVIEGFHRAFDLAKAESYPLAPWGVNTLHAARGALAEFYRLAPDWWIFKVIAGVRGDKEKSWFYADQLPVNEVGTANIVARSALCYGAESENDGLIRRGVEVLKQGVELDLIQSFDEPEYRRLARLYNGVVALEEPDDAGDYFELGCHEFGNDDRTQLQGSSKAGPGSETEVGLKD